MSDVTVRDNPAKLRYEAREGDRLLGEIRYRTEPGLVVLVHTEVASSAEGKGVGTELVAGARRHPLARAASRPYLPVRRCLRPPPSRVRRSRSRGSSNALLSPSVLSTPCDCRLVVSVSADRVA